MKKILIQILIVALLNEISTNELKIESVRAEIQSEPVENGEGDGMSHLVCSNQEKQALHLKNSTHKHFYSIIPTINTFRKYSQENSLPTSKPGSTDALAKNPLHQIVINKAFLL